MKIKLISLTIATMCLSQAALAQVKTLDFYSTSGSSRYSILGEMKELNLPTDKNSVLITNANNAAYVTLNNKTPFLARFIENDLNLYQMIEASKGQMISHNGKNVKVVGVSTDKLIVEQDNKISFIPLVEVSFPKSLLNDAQKGLKVSFPNDVKDNDLLFFSQPERQLSYKNTYEAVIQKDKINISHYLNVNNGSNSTFENVHLNFFLSETNVREYSNRMPMVATAMAMSGMMKAERSAMRDEAPSFDSMEIQDLKSIKIQKPMNIYPNLNKIKYTDKQYSAQQYVDFELNPTYVIYIESNEDKRTEKEILLEKIEEQKNEIKMADSRLRNMIEITVGKNDIFPSGKFDLYENVSGQDKLIVSSQIPHTENEPVKLLKSQNNDLKIKDVTLKEVRNLKRVDENGKKKVTWLTFDIESLEIKNESDKEYLLNVFNKKVKIGPNALVKVVKN